MVHSVHSDSALYALSCLDYPLGYLRYINDFIFVNIILGQIFMSIAILKYTFCVDLGYISVLEWIRKKRTNFMMAVRTYGNSSLK